MGALLGERSLPCTLGPRTALVDRLVRDGPLDHLFLRQSWFSIPFIFAFTVPAAAYVEHSRAFDVGAKASE